LYQEAKKGGYSVINSLEKFEHGQDKIQVEVSDDGLYAYITIKMEDTEFQKTSRSDLLMDVLRALKEHGVVYGIKNEVLLQNLANNRKILVAEGTPPINGRDAIIKMYSLKEVKPETKEDGKVNHYELSLINKVSAGDWLGEKIYPTEGLPGRTVKGSIIRPVRGKNLPLMYDRKTVKEVYEKDKSTLYALINGAVHFDGDRIQVSNHLEMLGDINFRTGNIDFDGYLTIKGTIEDGFSVAAEKDIEILGEIGIGSVREVVSRDGSIYIRGGIAGNNKAIIRSKKNIYTKFVSNATIECEGCVHIGFYCLNSNIKAKEVILDSPKGQIIGGNIKAEIRVVSSIIGSTGEKRTFVSVSGFNRDSMKAELDSILPEIEKLKLDLTRVKLDIASFDNYAALSVEQMAAYNEAQEKYYNIRDKLSRLEEKRKTLSGYLKTRGEGEVAILKKAYPNTQIEIKGKIKEITSPVISTAFFVQDGELMEI